MKPIIAHKGKIIARNFMTKYPSGEPAWKPGIEIPNDSVIGFQWNGSINDIIAFCSWMDTTSHTPFGCTAVIPFLPCSRQDKDGPVDGDQSRGAQFILSMLQDSNVEKVVLLDNHSTDILKPYGEFVENMSLINVTSDLDCDLIVSPDHGGIGRAHKVSCMNGAPVICAEKVREQSSGKITTYSFPETVSKQYKKILVVDDIIDGGYTFVLLGERLKKIWPKAEITLACTHGVLSGFPNMPEAFRFYDKVVMTNSCVNAGNMAHVLNLKMKVEIIEVVERITIERSLENA